MKKMKEIILLKNHCFDKVVGSIKLDIPVDEDWNMDYKHIKEFMDDNVVLAPWFKINEYEYDENWNKVIKDIELIEISLVNLSKINKTWQIKKIN